MLRSAVSRTTLKAVGQSGLGGSSSHADGMHPNLGLHNAAATGNIGLVKFALENGQPANSNLNGILPLHAACSGGSEQSVRMLIFHGADVNAPRLKAKGSSGGPGAEGSTPLHFAAANGHLEIVRVLLEAGARPAAADKDGVVPEALALGNGHTECANLIRSWISAYGSNGLAGMVESRDIVSGDVTLGPAGYIRYAASGRSASPISPTSAAKVTPTSFVPSSSSRGGSGSTTPQLPASASNSRPSATPASAALSPQSSSDTLSASSGVKLAALRSAHTIKSGPLCKTTSNPNLRNPNSASGTPPLPVASPVSPSASQLQSGTAIAAFSPGIGAFAPIARHDLNDHATPGASRSSSATSGVGTNIIGASNSGSVRESKRRPSLPSILEKAAHPAASLRAALAGSSSAHMGGSVSQASSSKHWDQSYDGITATSPGKKYSKLAGKRSLSGMLRKATGSTPSASQSTTFTPSLHASSSSFFADASAASSTSLLSGGAINMDALTKPGRVSGKSFDYQRPSAPSSTRGLRRNIASESFSEDADASSATTSFTHPPLPTSRSDAAALDQQRRLRSASSSSSLSAAPESSVANTRIRRTRAGSNEQPSYRTASSNRLPLRANASLDLLRPGYFSHAEDHGSGPPSLAGRKSVERSRTGFNQDSRTEAMKRAGAAQPPGLEGTSQRTGNPLHLSGRDRSVSGSSSRSAGTTDNDRSHAGSMVEGTADEDDVQEFLHHSESDTGDRTLDGGEHHDAHRLPAGLRAMTAFRHQTAKEVGDSAAVENCTSISAQPASDSANDNNARPSNALTSRMTRDRSGSHTSAISTGSQSGNSIRGARSAPVEAQSRASPIIPANYQALSIAEENGVIDRNGPIQVAGPFSTLSRTGRAPSVAGSLASHPSSSSLRSNYLSAAEQAQAILNHEAPYAPDGPDGTSTSLAAQLAAYGEALAMERRRAGDARSGPSPSLSARGSNAALRSKLPSVSEDQSPSRPAGHSSRSFSVSENRTQHLPATAAQSYNRRVSRRPHSSEGRQSQEHGKRGVLGSDTLTMSSSTVPLSDRTKPGSDPSPSPGDDAQGKGHGQGSGQSESPSPSDGQRVASPNLAGLRGLASPRSQSAHKWTASEHALRFPHATPTQGLGYHASSAPRTYASDSGEESAPMVPPQDQRWRRRNPAVYEPATDPTLSLDARGKHDAAEVDDEDEDDPKTPVLGGTKAVLDQFATSPRSLHRHSPSMPTELHSYTAARQSRSPGPPRHEAGERDSTNLTSPMLLPRKESINVPPLVPFGLEEGANPHMSKDSQNLNRAPAMWSSRRSTSTTSGGDETSREQAFGSTSSRWEGLRRPSLNMLRSATSSSTQSQTPSHASRSGTDEHTFGRWSTDETPAAGKGDQSTGSAMSQQQTSSKRRLVRNLLSKAKGSS